MIFREKKSENRKTKTVTQPDFISSGRRRKPEGNSSKHQGDQLNQKKSFSAPDHGISL